MSLFRLVLPALTFLCLTPGNAAGQTFSDVPKTDSLYPAVAYLQERGILSGYPDGTFRPNANVNRAEAVKIIVTSVETDPDDLSRMGKSPYADVPSDAWFRSSVEWARTQLKIIDGPPKAETFSPGRTVTKAEFLKMLLPAQGMDPASYSEIKLPLSPDVTDATAWYYPYLRLSFATSMSMINPSGLIRPEKQLTRADVALLLHRLLLYKEGKRTQDLLSQVETELLSVIDALTPNGIRTAEHASARALLAARGANTSMPNDSLVSAALKLTEAYRALVRGYRASLEERYDDAIALSKDTWFIASKAVELHPTMRPLATTVQQSAAKLASDARRKK